jgi:tRNA 2-thiouridine synthesizing protein A
MDLDEPILVDARGHRCPAPTLRLQRALAKAAPGQIVRLLADDPMASIDVPHFAAGSGLRLEAVRIEGQVIAFDVSREP